MRKRPDTEVIHPEVLVKAYRQGIFPMADSVTGKIEWFRAEPRGVVDLDKFHIPRRLERELRQNPFEIRVDTAFEQVVAGCASREDTWISSTIERSYVALYEAGYAHSVEAWRDDLLEGGLYGVAIGGAFFGESMFHRAPNASKAALIALVERLKKARFSLLDVQMVTPLTAQFGAYLIQGREYERQLRLALAERCEWDENPGRVIG